MVKTGPGGLRGMASDGSPPSGYAGLVRRHGFAPRAGFPWLSCGAPRLRQGWKLHLSSIPSEARLLLMVLLPLLREAGVAFKLALDEGVLRSLNEGGFGLSQVGKFVTIYPGSDAEAVALARTLMDALDGFSGPAVPSDRPLSGIVHARYGAFEPRVTRDQLGQTQRWIEAPNGEFVEDRYTIPFELPAGIEDPFAALGGAEAAAPPPEHLLGPGFLVLDRLRAQAKGDVLLALDMRSREHVAARIVKQGRAHCLSDEFGRDMRTRIRRQYLLHRALAPRAGLPRAELRFDADGDSYLVLDRIEGDSIETFARQALGDGSWRELDAQAQRQLIAVLARVARRAGELHAIGFVHRDLSPSNVFIVAEGEVALLDLELAHGIDEAAAPFGRGTEGFMSPNQQASGPPVPGDDVYALGCILALVMTGLDPRRIPMTRLRAALEGNDPAAEELFAGTPLAMRRIAADALAPDPARRPTADALADRLAAISVPSTGRAKARAHALSTGEIEAAIEAAARGLVSHVAVTGGNGLWLSHAAQRGSTHAEHAPELCRSAHRGVAGPIYALARGVRLGLVTPDAALRGRVGAAADWLLSGAPSPDSGMAGLHFGSAGVALALAEAAAAGLLDAAGPPPSLLEEAFAALPDWFDVTHGAAGIGFAAVGLAELKAGPPGDAARRAAALLLAEQRDGGAWVTPGTVEGMSGETLTGFAHGAAGIVAFLATVARLEGDDAARAGAARGAEWLLGQAAREPDGRIGWPCSDRNPDRWRWWCHGAPGIALGLLHAHAAVGDERLLDSARAALRTHHPRLRGPNLSLCHGLAGIADILLEAFSYLGEEEWLDRASAIVRFLLATATRHEDGALTWLVENAQVPVADLMVGCSGILHLLTRLRAAQEGRPVSAALLPVPLPPRAHVIQTLRASPEGSRVAAAE